MRPGSGGPSPSPHYEIEIGILFAAIVAIVLVTLAGEMDLSMFF